MTETYGQVRDVLNEVVVFYRRLRDFYDELAEQTDRERVRMMLDYMSRHAAHFETTLAEYDRQRGQSLLDMWMQFVPSERALKVPKAETLHGDMTVDEVVELALRMDEELAAFYEEAARLATVPEVQELFERLGEQQEDERERLKVNAAMIKAI